MMNVNKKLTREELAKVMEGMYRVMTEYPYTVDDFRGTLSDGTEWVYSHAEAYIYDDECGEWIVPTGMTDDDDDIVWQLSGLGCYDLENDVKALGAFFGAFYIAGEETCDMWYDRKIRSLFDITPDTAEFFRDFFAEHDDYMREWFADGVWSTCEKADED